MSKGERGQVSDRTAAELYEELNGPALGQEWVRRVADAAQIQSGQRVLDVACGTGVLAREAANRVGPHGAVIGVDLNEGMLAVARSKAPEIEWRQSPAELLPFDGSSFDAVVSQFGLMFFDNRRAAIQEMMRVLRPGGRLAVAVWGALEDSPGYAAFDRLVRRLCGEQAAAIWRAAFVLGNPQVLQAVFTEAGLPDAELSAQIGTARFPSIQALVNAEVQGWTLGELIDEAGLARLRSEAEVELRPFVRADSQVTFDMPALIVTATKG